MRDCAERTGRGRRFLVGAIGTLAVSLASAEAASGQSFTQLPVFAGGSLRDLQPASSNPTDAAQATLIAVPAGDSTLFFLFVRGLDPSAAGSTFGAHIHVGPCVPGNGAAAGPHYNTTGGAVITPETEVWLDFTVLPGGFGFATTTVPFVIEPGTAQSLVVHQLPTQADGGNPGFAGARIACLPVDFGSGSVLS
jgi:Cu/Zn superoxide dismutase